MRARLNTLKRILIAFVCAALHFHRTPSAADASLIVLSLSPAPAVPHTHTKHAFLIHFAAPLFFFRKCGSPSTFGHKDCYISLFPPEDFGKEVNYKCKCLIFGYQICSTKLGRVSFEEFQKLLACQSVAPVMTTTTTTTTTTTKRPSTISPPPHQSCEMHRTRKECRQFANANATCIWCISDMDPSSFLCVPLQSDKGLQTPWHCEL